MQSLHRAPLFFRFCLPILPFEEATFARGGGCVIRRLVLRGRCTLSPLPTGGNDAFSWRSREFGRKVSPVLGPRRGILTAPETFRRSRPRRRFPRYRVVFESSGYRFTEWTAYSGKIVPHRGCTSAKKYEMLFFERIFLCSLDFYFFLFLNKHVVICIVYTWK